MVAGWLPSTNEKLYPPLTQSPGWINRFPSMLDGPMENVFPVGGVPQENVDVEKLMSTVFCMPFSPGFGLFSSNNEAVPETVKSPVRGPRGFVTVPLKVKLLSGVTGIESVMTMGEPEVGVKVRV